MLSVRWEPAHYQLQTGKWWPEARLFEEVPGGIESSKIQSSAGKVFDTEEEARDYSNALAARWVRENYG